MLPFEYLAPYFGYFILSPRWLESPKRIIQKKRQQQIRDEDVSFILSFIYWVQQTFRGWGSFFLNTLKWLNPPVKVSKIR